MKWKGLGGYEEKEENLLLSVVPFLLYILLRTR